VRRARVRSRWSSRDWYCRG